ncbi:hypothetical protein ABPG74_013097 [Tetrahymena malaccensis]
MNNSDQMNRSNDQKQEQQQISSSDSIVNSRDLKTQNTINEIMQILQSQKQSYIQDKKNEHRTLVQQRKKENLEYRKIQTYQKEMELRQPFLSRPKNDYQYFENDHSKYLKRDPNIKDRDPNYYLLPERAKNPIAFHVSSGKDSAGYTTISKIEMSKMGAKERIRYQIWEEIRKQREKEQQLLVILQFKEIIQFFNFYIQTYQLQSGAFKKSIYYDSKSQSRPQIFKPTDSRNSLFQSNPSSIYEVPRTPRSNMRLIQLNRIVEKNSKWNPNNSGFGVFDHDIYKENNSFTNRSTLLPLNA